MICTNNGSPRDSENCCDTGLCQRETLHIPSGEHYKLCEAVHAEQNAIICAGYDRTKDAILYLYGREGNETLKDVKPCHICARMIKNAGIKQVIYLKKAILSPKTKSHQHQKHNPRK